MKEQFQICSDGARVLRDWRLRALWGFRKIKSYQLPSSASSNADPERTSRCIHDTSKIYNPLCPQSLSSVSSLSSRVFRVLTLIFVSHRLLRVLLGRIQGSTRGYLTIQETIISCGIEGVAGDAKDGAESSAVQRATQRRQGCTQKENIC